jgi:lipopolysaccharide export system permease protein
MVLAQPETRNQYFQTGKKSETGNTKKAIRMSTTVNRYIAAKVFFGILIAFLIITSIIMLVDFVEASRNVDAGSDISLVTLMVMTLLNAPRLVEETVPFVVLFGVMGALFSLNRRSELIVLRASGLSAWRFLKPAALVTALVGVVWTIAFNPLAALSAQKYESIILNAANAGEIKPSKTDNVWLREGDENGQLVIHAKRSDVDTLTLYDAAFYYFGIGTNGEPVFSGRYDVKSAQLTRNNYWVLNDVLENEDGKPSQKYSLKSIPTSITRDTFRAQTRSGRHPPFWRLRGEINKARQSGFDVTPLIMQFHKLLALPITLIAMAIIAAGASLNMSREGGTLKLMITGAALGFGVYFVDNIISAFGETGALPPLLAAWSVPLLVLCGGLVYLAKIEDG